MSTAAFFGAERPCFRMSARIQRSAVTYEFICKAIILFSQLICKMFVFVTLLKWLSKVALSLQFIYCFNVEDSIITYVDIK